MSDIIKVVPSDVVGFKMRNITVVVKRKAMGSLLPLSNSRRGPILCFKPCFLERKIENTAAASVDEIIEPINKDSNSGKCKTQ